MLCEFFIRVFIYKFIVFVYILVGFLFLLMEGDFLGLYNMKNIYYCIVGSDIFSNVDRDGIVKIEGVLE